MVSRRLVLSFVVLLVFSPLAAVPMSPSSASIPGDTGPTTGVETRSASAGGDPPIAARAPDEDLVDENSGFRNELVFDGLVSPTAFTFLPDGRILVLQKNGEVFIGNTSANPPALEPYLSLGDVQTGGEKGLLNIALDPEFESNGQIYLYYVNNTTNRQRVSRFTHVEGAGGLDSRADRSSEFVVWEDNENWTTCCHYGGGLDFGPEGKLYLTLGEESTDEGLRAQNYSKTGGKVLRFNPNGTVPADNPYVDDPDKRDRIWAAGLRNPFRASWDIPTERFFIGEVGGDDYGTSMEDIHLGKAGANYGWPYCEGACGNDSFDDPLYSYPHNGSDASLTGGFVYRGEMFPDKFHGAYFYGDYARFWIRYLTFDGPEEVASSEGFETNAGLPVSLDEGPDGALYYADIAGSVRRISYYDDTPPAIDSIRATPRRGESPLTVTFNATATDNEPYPVTYEWSFGDGEGTTARNATHTYDEPGVYSARLAVSDATQTARSEPIEIVVGNPPEATISAPENGSSFVAGDVIEYRGFARDTEDGVLGAENLTWTTVLAHSNHTHPFDGPVSGTNGSFGIPTSGHDYTGDTGHVIELTATDSDGLSDTERVRIMPEKVTMTYETAPEGLDLLVDGIRTETPAQKRSIVNFNRSVSAPETQCAGGSTYEFVGWENGTTAPTRPFSVPAEPRTYTANYTANGSCNAPPNLAAPDDVTLVAGETAALEVTASDPEGDALTLSANGLPAFAAFTDDGNGTGTLSLTPGANDTGTYPVTLTASDGNGTDTASVSVTVERNGSDGNDTDGAVIARVNAGGSGISADGLDWTASASSSATDAANTESTIRGIALDDSVPAGTPARMFKTGLYGGMNWSFPARSGVTYDVRLYFAEIAPDIAAGDRAFDVRVENETVIEGYDIQASVGADTGTMRTVTTTADDDSIDIELVGVKNNPKVSGVAVVAPPGTNPEPTLDVPTGVTVPAGTTADFDVAGSDMTGETVSLRAEQLPSFVEFSTNGGDGSFTVAPADAEPGVYNVTIAASDGTSTVTETVPVTVSDLPESSVLARVNAGGPTVPDSPNWTPSTGKYVTGGNGFATTDTVTADSSVPEGTPTELFQSELYGETDWSFPVRAGESYEVRVYTAEIDGEKGVDNRLFDVTVEGERILDAYDIYADVGTDAGTMRATTVTATNDDLSVAVGKVKNTPKISAVSVLRASGDPKVNEPPTASFTANVSTPTAGERVSFDGTESSDADGTLVDYSWEINSSHSHGWHDATLAHTFEDAGDYAVSLTVTDDDGATDTVETTIDVQSPSDETDDDGDPENGNEGSSGDEDEDENDSDGSDGNESENDGPGNGDGSDGANDDSDDAGGGFIPAPSDPSLPEIATPNGVRFGAVAVGSNETRSVSVRNTGSAPLRVRAVAITGPDADAFTATPGSFVVPSGGQTAVNVTYEPTAVERPNATLRLRTDDPDRGMVDIPLSVRNASVTVLDGNTSGDRARIHIADGLASAAYGADVRTDGPVSIVRVVAHVVESGNTTVSARATPSQGSARIATVETTANGTATVGNVTVTVRVGSDVLADRAPSALELRNPETDAVIPLRTLRTNESNVTLRASVPAGTAAVLSATTGSAGIGAADGENGTTAGTTESGPVPGFGPGVALAALAVLVLLFRRR